MTIANLRDRLRAARADERITLDEVNALLSDANANGSLNDMEEMFLRAALEAHSTYFDDEAREVLRQFLDAHAPKRTRR